MIYELVKIREALEAIPSDADREDAQEKRDELIVVTIRLFKDDAKNDYVKLLLEQIIQAAF